MSNGKVSATNAKALPEEWDVPALLHLTDAVRTCVTSGTRLSKDKVEFLELVLQKLLDEDKRGKQQTIPFIAQSRIELLVRDIVTSGMQTKDLARSSTPNTLELKCFALQRCWRKNFRPSYFVTTIDEERNNTMEEVSLRNVTFDPKEGRWTVQDAKSEHHSHTEGSLDFKPGQWWLNLACCYRDGMVGSMVDDLTKGPYGVTAIPLLSGEELESSVPGCFTYRRVGPIQDMYLSIMSQLGQKHVRILRGYKLKSPNAPKGGIRYDGLYTPIEYSHCFDAATNMYEVKLLFRRDEETPRAETLSAIPSPSQMDEWKLYLLMAVNEKEDIRPNRTRFEPQGKEERGSGLLKSPEFLEALKSESPSHHAKVSGATGAPKKKLVPQGSEERGMRASDFMDLLNEGPDDEGGPAPSSAKLLSPASSSSSRIPVAKPRNKMSPQGNDERASMRTSDLIDLLNQAPPGDSGIPVRSAAPTAAKSPTASEASSLKKGAAKAPVIAVSPTPASGNEEPTIVKKRVKPKDPYDIDQMMKDIEDEEDLDG